MNHIYECRILIIDDNQELLSLLLSILKKEGWQLLRTASSCQEAREAFRAEVPDLIILDVMLPDGDGFALFQEFRAQADVPILFLSARDQDNDRLLGLGLGADDYLTKPFLPRELILRMSAILRRTRRLEEPERSTFCLGRREIDLDAGEIRLLDGSGKHISLTNKEYQLLKTFSENRGRILTFDFLCEAVWGKNYYDYENTLMVHIRKLREKIEEKPSEPKFLITVKGLGYRLNR